jgi:F-type H+-transporting ATPase subunit b
LFRDLTRIYYSVCYYISGRIVNDSFPIDSTVINKERIRMLDLSHENITTAIATVINLLILYFILRKVLFKRVTQFMENRTNSIKEAMDNAEKSNAEAASLKLQYEEQLRSAKEEADRILNDARIRAGKEYEALIGNAKKDAESILVKAREEIEREREQMIKDIRGQVAGLAIIVASKVMEANMDNEKNKALAEKFINEAGVA